MDSRADARRGSDPDEQLHPRPSSGLASCCRDSSDIRWLQSMQAALKMELINWRWSKTRVLREQTRSRRGLISSFGMEINGVTLIMGY